MRAVRRLSTRAARPRFPARSREGDLSDRRSERARGAPRSGMKSRRAADETRLDRTSHPPVRLRAAVGRRAGRVPRCGASCSTANAAVVLFNPAAEELIGQPRGRAVGERCERIFAETPLIAEMVARVQAHGQSESRVRRSWCAGAAASRSASPVCHCWTRDDRVSGTALVIHDLGYQKTLEESVRRNESLARLGTMVAGLAHEVRNPLAGIKGAAQLLGRTSRAQAGAEGVHRGDQARGESPHRPGRRPADARRAAEAAPGVGQHPPRHSSGRRRHRARDCPPRHSAAVWLRSLPAGRARR